jgi:hypothetical protein
MAGIMARDAIPTSPLGVLKLIQPHKAKTSAASQRNVAEAPGPGSEMMAEYKTIAPAGSFDRWPAGMKKEMEDNAFSPIVGSVLVSETEKLRVWHLLVPAGQRCTFHRHVLDYFWTCHSNGKARGFYDDGRITETTHFPGDTMHMTYAKGEYLLHSVENIGDTDLLFTTVEFLDSANAPLPIPDGVRLQRAA